MLEVKQEDFNHFLEKDEFLMKIRDDDNSIFLTKLNKDGSIPVKFKEWEEYYCENVDKVIYTKSIFIFKEIFRKGWKLLEWRFGMSQNWAKLETPEGYKIEIRLNNFLDICKNSTIINGEIQGEFKWNNSELIKKTDIK